MSAPRICRSERSEAKSKNLQLSPDTRPAISRTRDVPLQLATLTFLLTLLGGCHSRFVEADIDNQTATPLKLVEVDYPSASFGIGSIAAHSVFHYRFKVQGSGSLKLEFSDAQGAIHNAEGPELHEGQEGRVTIVIDPAGNVAWKTALTVSQ